jgi:orotate phosphoribosyltransferase
VILRALGERVARLVDDVEPEAARLAGPELGAVALAASAAIASGRPFLIVRKEAKGYATGNRVEGGFDPGELVCLVEDVVTSGGAAVEAVVALRAAGLRCDTAICVVDREEGGVDALARRAVRLHPLFRASEIAQRQKTAAKPHG